MGKVVRSLRTGLILVLTGLAGCQDSPVGTIKADHRAVEKVLHSGSDARAPSRSPSRASGKAPDTNDLSPKFRGGEARP